MSTKNARLFLMLVLYLILPMCKGTPLFTLEEEADYEGENFCSTKNGYFLKRMCIHLAYMYGWDDYDQSKLSSSCSTIMLEIYSTEAERYRHPKRTMLPCSYYDSEGGVKHRALGKGPAAADAAEYKLGTNGYEPYDFLTSFLTNV